MEMEIKNRKSVSNDQNGYNQDTMMVDDVKFTFDFGGLQDYPGCGDNLNRNMRSGYLQGFAKFQKKWLMSTSFINIQDFSNEIENFEKDVEDWKIDFIKMSLKKLLIR